MKNDILETILHIFHIVHESLKTIGIALAKSLGTSGKSQLLLARKIVFVSFVITSASVVGFSETNITTVNDGPYIHPQASLSVNNTTISNNTTYINNTPLPLCSRCNGTGKIYETYYVDEWISCKACGGTGLVDNGEFQCYPCGGTGGHYETVPKTREITCPACGGTGYESV